MNARATAPRRRHALLLLWRRRAIQHTAITQEVARRCLQAHAVQETSTPPSPPRAGAPQRCAPRRRARARARSSPSAHGVHMIRRIRAASKICGMLRHTREECSRTACVMYLRGTAKKMQRLYAGRRNQQRRKRAGAYTMMPSNAPPPAVTPRCCRCQRGDGARRAPLSSLPEEAIRMPARARTARAGSARINKPLSARDDEVSRGAVRRA